MRLTQKISFSSGHRYWREDLSDESNREMFGKWASPYNHGHNYTLNATIEGPIDRANGMVINIKILDDLMKARIASKFDQRSINDEVEAFRVTPPTLENLVAYFAESLGDLPTGVKLVRINLIETSRLSADWTLTEDGIMITLTRKYEFCASHRLHSEQLTPDENIELFGKCNNPNGHGHNYVLEVTVTGEKNPESGMMVALGELDECVNRLVVDYLDHKNLNLDIPEFGKVNPTSEAVTEMIWNRLDKALPARLVKVRLRETDRNSFEIVRG